MYTKLYLQKKSLLMIFANKSLAKIQNLFQRFISKNR
jgi:hypothetical protein